MTIKTTADAYQAHCEDGGGYCLKCGDEAFGVEPDARRYECESCGAKSVYGAEECVLMGRLVFTDDGEGE